MYSDMKVRKPVHNKTLGIEIEGYTNKHPNYYSYIGFFSVQRDGSIHKHWDSYDVEYVSQPLTPQWLKREIYKLYSKHPWDTNTSCGIHIHASKKWVSNKKALAIYKFYCSLTTGDQKELFGRETNDYCGMCSFGSTRYNAVNTTNSETIEFRMFASGHDVWAAYCVDMVCYLIQNAYHLNVDAALAFRAMYKF